MTPWVLVACFAGAYLIGAAAIGIALTVAYHDPWDEILFVAAMWPPMMVLCIGVGIVHLAPELEQRIARWFRR